jgi:hypothetical protein
LAFDEITAVLPAAASGSITRSLASYRHRVGLHQWQEVVGADQIVYLATGQMEAPTSTCVIDIH